MLQKKGKRHVSFIDNKIWNRVMNIFLKDNFKIPVSLAYHVSGINERSRN